MNIEKYESFAYPGVYPNENDIIPYSKNKRFGFTSPGKDDKFIKLESMKDMSIDQLIQLYKDGYKIEDTSPTIATTQGVTISTGSLFLIIGTVGVIWYLKTKGKI